MIVAVLGPTASGKSAVALEIARHLGADIVSVDSMQVYRGMDIGTAKATAADRKLVRHHMIDLVEPEDAFTAAQFQATARAVIDGATKPIVIAGGSGLHFRAVVDPLEFPPTDDSLRAELDVVPMEELRARLLAIDPGAGTHVDLANPRRVTRALEIAELTGATPSSRWETASARQVRRYQALYQFVAYGLDRGAGLADAITTRLDGMRHAGLTAEVAGLAERLGPTAANAVGYRQLLPVVHGEKPEAEGYEDARQATMALAKRQRTFFRRDPRIRWISATDDAVETIMRELETM